MSTNEKSLSEIMTDFEYVEFELEQILDLLSIFDERVSKDVELLNDGWQTERFKKRYQASQSLLYTLCVKLTNTIEPMTEAIQAGYRLSRNIKAAAHTE